MTCGEGRLVDAIQRKLCDGATPLRTVQEIKYSNRRSAAQDSPLVRGKTGQSHFPYCFNYVIKYYPTGRR
jgi:hypothetical protein